MQADQINVFISHSWTYSEHYDKLAGWIFRESWNSNGVPIQFADNRTGEEAQWDNEMLALELADLDNMSFDKAVLGFGEVTLKNGQFIAEVRGLAQKLSQNIVELYSPTCRAIFGDGRCKANLASYTVGGSVKAMSQN